MNPRKALDRARGLHQKGELAEAERLYRFLLQRDGGDVDALHGLGLLYARCGRFEDARQLVDRALGLHPGRPEFHFHRAEIAGALGMREQALESYRQALVLRPDFFEVLVNMGDLLLQMGRTDEPLALLEQAIRLRPDDAAALNNRGNALQALKRHEEALQSFERVLQLLPGNPDVLNNRASALLSLGRFAEAADACRQALAQRADHVPALLNLGRAQAGQDLLEEALQHYDAALALQPAHFDGWRERAALLAGLRRYREARESLGKALALNADSWSDWADLGSILLRLGRPQDALEACDRALALQRNDAALWATRGLALQFLGRDTQAAAAHQNALWLDPGAPYVEGRLAALRLGSCEWGAHAAATGRILRGVRAGEPAVEPFTLLHLTDRADDQLRCAQTYARAQQPRAARALWEGERYSHGRIRLAYLLGDLREHPSATRLAVLLEGHDRSRFELFGFALGAAAPAHFIDLREATDAEIAARLRHHEIDIAVGVMGGADFGRSAIYGLRPCPVQVTFPGYPGTLGSDCCDYLVADAHVIPAGREACYAENVVRLPDTFQASDTRRPVAPRVPTRTELGLPEEGAVFCAFHTASRITPEMYGAWMDILVAVKDSVLWLASGSDSMQGNLRRAAQARGVGAERLVFAPRAEHAEHLARLQHADLALDTLPFNGNDAASDALRRGVPVITCCGDALAARMAGSLLHAIGMPELVTSTLEDYKALAIRLGGDPQLLAETRRKLAANRLTHPLFDTGRFRRHIEAAYEIMWQRYQAGEPPAAFSVDAIADTRVAPA